MTKNIKYVICCLITSIILFSGSVNAFGAPVDITVPYAVLREGYSDAEFDHLTYDDSFFEESSGKYDHGLALMSYGLSMASFGRKEAPADKNIKTLFDKMGFDMDSYVSYGCDKEDSPETIALALCTKTVSFNGTETKLLAVALRSINYGKEGWVSNFTMGTSEDGDLHKSFYDCADFACGKIEKYINDRGIGDKKNLKVWMSGYSRSAPIAGIISMLLSDEERTLKLDPDNVYTYSFATANYGIKGFDEGKRTNAFHIMNPNDIIVAIPPAGWGFEKSGRIKVLPFLYEGKVKNRYTEAVQKRCKELSGLDYRGFLYEQPFMVWAVHEICSLVPEWDDYGKFQDLVVSVIRDEINIDPAMKFILKLIGKDVDKMVADIKKEIKNVRTHYDAGNAEKTRKSLESLYSKTEEIENLVNMGKSFGIDFSYYLIVTTFLKDGIIGAEREIDSGFMDSGDEMPNLLMIVDTAYAIDFDVPPYLVDEHFPEYYLSWLLETGEEDLRDGETFHSRTLIVDGKMDVTVSSNGNEVIAVKDDRVLAAEDSRASASIFGSKTRVFCLPVEDDYEINIIAPAKDSFDFTIYKNTLSASSEKIMEKKGIPCEEGYSFILTISGNKVVDENIYEDPEDTPENEDDKKDDEEKEKEGDKKDKTPEEIIADNNMALPEYPEVIKDPSNALIAGTKTDISARFPETTGRRRFFSTDKKVLSVNKKGIAKAKKGGKAALSLSVKNGAAYDTVSSCEITVEEPVMLDKISLILGEETSLNAYSFFAGSSYAPSSFASSREKVAAVDAKGDIHVLKKGKTRIYAVFGSGKSSSKKKYYTTLIVKEK